MIKIGKLFFSFYLFPFLLWAQNSVQVTVDVDRDRVALGDTFIVTVSVQSNEMVNNEEPQLPQLNGMALVGREENTAVQQSLQSTPQGMDWKTLRKKNYFYRMQAAQVGRLQLDPIEVVVEGKLYQTRPLLIEVLPAGEKPEPNGAQGAQEEESPEERFLREQDEIFNQLLRRHMIPQVPQAPGRAPREKEPEYRSLPTNPNEAFFVQLEVDKTSVYEGEQVTATWYLVTRGQMETLDRAKFPALKGFWKEIIEENPQIQFFEEVINGIPYRKALMATHALFPIRAGKAIIDEFTVKSRIRMPSAGFGMGFGRAYEYTKSSKRLEIQVKALPLEGRPREFTGSVGQFEVMSQVDQTVKHYVGQPISVKVRFEGEGNAKTLELPLIEWPEGLELYDTKNESRFFKDGRSYKEFQILVIPRKEGELQIPEIRFAYFNPKTEKYETKVAPAIAMQVLPEAEGKKSDSGSFLGLDSPAQAPRVLSLPGLQKDWQPSVHKGQLAQNLWMGLFFSGFLGLLGFGYYELRPRSRSWDLKKTLEMKMTHIHKQAELKNFRQVGAEVVNACNLLLAEVTSHKGEILEIKRMLDLLPPELRAKSAAELESIYEKAQVYGFAPEDVINQQSLHEDLPKFAKRAEAIIMQVCESWKPRL